MKRCFYTMFMLVLSFTALSEDQLQRRINEKINEEIIDSLEVEERKEPEKKIREEKKNRGIKGKKEISDMEDEISTEEFLAVSKELVDSAKKVVLGSPTDTSIKIKALAVEDSEVYFEYGRVQDKIPMKTSNIFYKENSIIEIVLESLDPNTRYNYRMLSKKDTESIYTELQKGSFYTQKGKGETFTFTIQADPHRDEKSSTELYKKMLENVLNDNPDFHIDLGDTFMGEKFGKTPNLTLQRYLEDRALFTKITGRTPLFLVNGNHEGEAGWHLEEGTDNIAHWASEYRKSYFPTPQKDLFYSGSHIDKGNYYEFTWGDAHFIILDPFWFSREKLRNNNDGWVTTLGKEQYEWLKDTLRRSVSEYKFVFIHNLVGGYGREARGGAEASVYFEWGGKNKDGSEGFDTMRSGWGKPIHEILVENKVTAVFHGHDHFYAKQFRDGIVYQLVPQASHPGKHVRNATEYSYLEGLFLPPAGHLRITVSSEEVEIDYISASVRENKNKILVNSYKIKNEM